MGRSTFSSAPAKPKRPRQSVAELAPQILELLPAKAATVARQLDRAKNDGTVRRALENLVKTGAAKKRKDGTYERCQELPTLVPPRGADNQAKRLHAELLKVCQEQGTWRDHDIGLLNDLVRREQQARSIEAHVESVGEFQVGESGRVYAHPGIDKARDARRDVQALREALVLTPDARKKHGRDGDAEDEDGDELDFGD